MTRFGFRVLGVSLLIASFAAALQAKGFYCLDDGFGLRGKHARSAVGRLAVDPNELIVANHYAAKAAQPLVAVNADRGTDFGIKEVVPAEFKSRYDKWKAELLSTDVGLKQWDSYANNNRFLLKIIVTSDKKFGAGTDDYKWDDNGELVGATITLGKNLDRGYPDPVYYPVMNSLAAFGHAAEIDGSLLASTKFAHEIGHVESTGRINGKVFEQQEKLMAAYYKIFLNNGYNTQDARLVKLAGELGRQPIEIWEDREYWGEANAMRYLIGRISKEYFFCSVIGHIMRNVNDYARTYEDRFDQIAETIQPPSCRY